MIKVSEAEICWLVVYTYFFFNIALQRVVNNRMEPVVPCLASEKKTSTCVQRLKHWPEGHWHLLSHHCSSGDGYELGYMAHSSSTCNWVLSFINLYPVVFRFCQHACTEMRRTILVKTVLCNGSFQWMNRRCLRRTKSAGCPIRQGMTFLLPSKIPRPSFSAIAQTCLCSKLNKD